MGAPEGGLHRFSPLFHAGLRSAGLGFLERPQKQRRGTGPWLHLQKDLQTLLVGLYLHQQCRLECGQGCTERTGMWSWNPDLQQLLPAWVPELLGWPKSLFGMFCKILWKNPNEIFGQPNGFGVCVRISLIWQDQSAAIWMRWFKRKTCESQQGLLYSRVNNTQYAVVPQNGK